ncbi:MAG: hypothetical protein NC395_00600 [Prevotella sp.]|nr:hypothetical protein [Prevotella sp.]
MKKIKAFEPWIFIFFGVFHLHRIWGLTDRKSYADFWLEIMESKGTFYYVLTVFLAILCICGIITFLKNLHNNFWWRWIYIFCGGYLLFDLFAIITGLKFRREIILKMFDISAFYWNMLWGMFIVIGGFSFGLGIKLLCQRQKIKE